MTDFAGHKKKCFNADPAADKSAAGMSAKAQLKMKGEYKMTYYKNWALAYNECSDEMKQKSREHWRKVHAENCQKKKRDILSIWKQ